MTSNIQLILGVFTILFSGVGAYIGIRVGIAEVKRDIKALDQRINSTDIRLGRLEGPYFTDRGRPGSRS